MGVIELFLYILIVAFLGYAAVWLLGKLAPGHPAILDTLVWLVVVVVVVIVVAQALGVAGLDPKVPHLR